VVLEIGKLTAVLPDAVRFSFDLCTAGTLLEGAELEIIEVPGKARCRACDNEVLLAEPFGRCVCESTDLEWTGGQELKIKEYEVE
jgi:hydrogenase nickel incorporation protein HypA/HybF